DDRGPVKQLDDAAPAVGRVGPEDGCGGDLGRMGRDGADPPAVTYDGDDLARMAVPDRVSRGQSSGAEIGVALAAREPDARRFAHPDREELGMRAGDLVVPASLEVAEVEFA